MNGELRPGEKLDMNTRVDGGPTGYRDSMSPGCCAIYRHACEIAGGDTGRLVEVAGLEVTYNECPKRDNKRVVR